MGWMGIEDSGFNRKTKEKEYEKVHRAGVGVLPQSAGRVQFNSVCRSCRNHCKQSYRAEILSCRRYEGRKQPPETQENETAFPMLVETEK